MGQHVQFTQSKVGKSAKHILCTFVSSTVGVVLCIITEEDYVII